MGHSLETGANLEYLWSLWELSGLPFKLSHKVVKRRGSVEGLQILQFRHLSGFFSTSNSRIQDLNSIFFWQPHPFLEKDQISRGNFLANGSSPGSTPSNSQVITSTQFVKASRSQTQMFHNRLLAHTIYLRTLNMSSILYFTHAETNFHYRKQA